MRTRPVFVYDNAFAGKLDTNNIRERSIRALTIHGFLGLYGYCAAHSEDEIVLSIYRHQSATIPLKSHQPSQLPTFSYHIMHIHILIINP
jgi:hypothetical protein